MKRINIQAAFVGEPSAGSEGLDTADSDEAVTLVIRGGELTAVVPHATPDGRVLDAATCLRGTLHLENERVLTFEIQDEAVGAYFEHEPVALHWRREAESAGDLFRVSPGAPLFAQPAAASTPVSAIMSNQIVTAKPSMPMRDLADLLAFHRVSGVPVVDADDRLVGVVSEADVISRVGQTVGDMMSREVVSVPESASVAQAATLMAERHVRRVPVVRDGRVVGIVSRGDVVRWLAAAT